MGQVDPVAHPLGKLPKFVHMAQNRLATLGVELSDPDLFDVGLAAEAQLLLHREFHWKAMAVPPSTTGHRVALHRPVARKDVLENPRLNVMGAWRAVGGRRPLVEHPRRSVCRAIQASR